MSTDQNNDTDTRSSSAPAESDPALQWANEPDGKGYYYTYHQIKHTRRLAKVWKDDDQVWRIQYMSDDHGWKLKNDAFTLLFYGPLPTPPEPEPESAG